MRRSSAVTVTDLFCGAGGSSLGAQSAGMTLRLAMNHWRVAIDTHSTNFPDADHVCADVSTTDPRRYQSTDILIASPECTNHTSAKGKPRQTNQLRLLDNGDVDPAAERSRATMWDVPRFAERHQYALIVVENVVEAREWVMFDAWLMAMASLGYDNQFVFANSMHTLAVPQSRDRMYVVFWRRGNHAPDLDFRPLAPCGACEIDVRAIQTWKRPDRHFGRYRSQYVFRCPVCAAVVEPYARPAADAIDWALPSLRIGDRPRPLAPKTIARIEAGIERYWPAAIVTAAGNTFEAGNYRRCYSTEAPLPTQTAYIQHGLAMVPLAVNLDHPGDAGHVWPVSGPLSTQTGRLATGLAAPPFLAILRGQSGAHLASKAMSTVSAGGIHHALVEPPLIAEFQGWSKARPVTHPLATVEGGGNHHGLVMRNNTGGAEMVTPAEEPLRTLTTAGHQSLIEPPLPLLTDYHGNGRAKPVTEPAGTMDTRDRFGLVEYGGVSVTDCHFRMLEPHEIGAAMAFPGDYVVTGTKRDRVRQYGNAVTPPVMAMLLERCMETLR